MSTLSEIATDIVASIAADHLGYPVVAKWVQLRYQQLATRVKLKHLRQLGQVNIPAAVSTGLASCTQGSKTVTLDVNAGLAVRAAQSTAGGTLAGWFIRGSVVWYEVAGFTYVAAGSSILTLKQPYTEVSVTSGGYVLVSRYTKVDPRASWIGRSWMHARRRRPLTLTTMTALNQQAPYRPLLTTSGPTHVAEGPEIDGVKTIEVYPYSSTLEALFYVYWQDTPEFSLTEELSPRIKAYAIKEGALIDAYRYLMNEALNKNAIDRAGFYSNLSAKQETKWDGYLQELILADQGDDDSGFLLKSTGGAGPDASDIRTARDHVWAR